jgi:hypothetical protein
VAGSLPGGVERSSFLADPLGASPVVRPPRRWTGSRPSTRSSAVGPPLVCLPAALPAVVRSESLLDLYGSPPRLSRRPASAAAVETRGSLPDDPPAPVSLLRACCRRCSKRYESLPSTACLRPAPGLKCTRCTQLKKPCDAVSIPKVPLRASRVLTACHRYPPPASLVSEACRSRLAGSSTFAGPGTAGLRAARPNLPPRSPAWVAGNTGTTRPWGWRSGPKPLRTVLRERCARYCRYWSRWLGSFSSSLC